MCNLHSYLSIPTHLQEFSQGGIQLSKVKDVMGKQQLNPLLLLFKSVVVYIFLSVTEGRLFHEESQCPLHIQGDGTGDGNSEFLVHHPESI